MTSQEQGALAKKIPGATHLFEEPNALRLVAKLAAEWFLLHLPEFKSAGQGV